jgi:adenine-specific DNA-methyltransferase
MPARHELVWDDKNRVLLGIEPGGRPVWATKEDLKPRRIIEHSRTGEYNPDSSLDPLVSGDNLLIHGDNLLALVAITERFAGKIKCVYIDPPFNTGNLIGHYDDELEDALWLSLMKPRLEALKTLLDPKEGLIAVHIDHREMAPLKMLMDEIFGKNNMLSLVTLKVKDTAGVGQQSLIFDVCEYLLIYATDLKRLRKTFRPTSGDPVEVKDFIRGYTRAVADFGSEEPVKTLRRPNAGEIKVFRFPESRIIRFGRRTVWEDYLKHFDRIFADYNPGGGMILKIRDELPATGLSCIEYTPTKGRDSGKSTRVYFLNRRILAWLRDIAGKGRKGRIVKKSRLTNLWEVPNAQLFSEGGVEFRQGKKPEALVARIIALATRDGEWVLDSFLGSGTTAAAAHKLGRRWIGIENGPHAETHCLPRLTRVVSGTDPTGITSSAGWKGGGNFRYCGLATDD